MSSVRFLCLFAILLVALQTPGVIGNESPAVTESAAEAFTDPADLHASPAPFKLARGRVYNILDSVATSTDPFRNLASLSPNSLLHHTLSKLHTSYNEFEAQRNSALDAAFPLATKLVHRACQSLTVENYREHIQLSTSSNYLAPNADPYQSIRSQIQFLEQNGFVPSQNAVSHGHSVHFRGILLRSYTKVEWQYLDTNEAWDNLSQAGRYLVNLDIPDVPEFCQGGVFTLEHHGRGYGNGESWRIWMTYKAEYLPLDEIQLATVVTGP